MILLMEQIFNCRKSTPAFVWVEWKKSDDARLKDIESYKLNINGETIAVLPSTENQFVINDGDIGRRYLIQIEVRLENQIFGINFSVYRR